MNYFSKNCKHAFQTILLEIDMSNVSKDITDIYSILEKLIQIGKLKAIAASYRKEGLIHVALQQELEADKINVSLPDGIRI